LIIGLENETQLQEIAQDLASLISEISNGVRYGDTGQNLSWGNTSTIHIGGDIQADVVNFDEVSVWVGEVAPICWTVWRRI